MKQLTPNRPHAIVMVGIPGAGKTFFAEHFAKTFTAPYINYSNIKSVVGDDSADNVCDLVINEIAKTGATFVYDGPSHDKKTRDNIVKKFKSKGYTPLLIWVQTESYEAKKRALQGSSGNKLRSSEFDEHIRLFQPPTDKENAVVISGKHTYATQLKIILKRISASSPERTTKQIRVVDSVNRTSRTVSPR